MLSLRIISECTIDSRETERRRLNLDVRHSNRSAILNKLKGSQMFGIEGFGRGIIQFTTSPKMDSCRKSVHYFDYLANISHLLVYNKTRMYFNQNNETTTAATLLF